MSPPRRSAFNHCRSHLQPGEWLFPLALQRALAQTYAKVEVVADNCSSDHTGEVVRRNRDPRAAAIRGTGEEQG